MDTNQIEYSDRTPMLKPYLVECMPKTVQYPCVMVLNTDPADEAGEHWVALYFDENGQGEYFDSWNTPPTLLQVVHEKAQYIMDMELDTTARCVDLSLWTLLCLLSHLL